MVYASISNYKLVCNIMLTEADPSLRYILSVQSKNKVVTNVDDKTCWACRLIFLFAVYQLWCLRIILCKNICVYYLFIYIFNDHFIFSFFIIFILYLFVIEINSIQHFSITLSNIVN